MVVEQVEAPAADDRRELEQHVALVLPDLAERRAERPLERQVAPAVARVAVVRPDEAVDRIGLPRRPARRARPPPRAWRTAPRGTRRPGWRRRLPAGSPRRRRRHPRGSPARSRARARSAASGACAPAATCRSRLPACLRRSSTTCPDCSRPWRPRWRASRACGSSAAPCAICCWGASRASSTWSWRGTRPRSRGGPRSGWAATCSCTTASAPPRCARRARRSISRARGGRPTRGRAPCPTWCSAPRSRRISRGATSPSTRSRCGWPTGRRPGGPARARTSTRACCACSTTARSATTRRGCCGLARYAARLGFAAEPHTAQLAAARGRRRRARDRLRGAARRGAAAAGPRADAGGAARAGARGPGRGAAAGRSRSTSRCWRRALALAPDDARADLVALATALRAGGAAGGRAAELAARLRALAFPAADAAAVVAAATAGAVAGRPSEVDAVLGRLPVEAAVVAAAAGSDGARDWLERGRRARLAIGGDDLLAAGLSGPAIGAGAARRAGGAAGRRGARPRGPARRRPARLAPGRRVLGGRRRRRRRARRRAPRRPTAPGRARSRRSPSPSRAAARRAARTSRAAAAPSPAGRTRRGSPTTRPRRPRPRRSRPGRRAPARRPSPPAA